MTDVRAKISLREQADSAHRELAMRHRVYPGLVKRGKMTEAEAEAEIALMRAIRDTLRLLEPWEAPLRAWLAQQIATSRIKDSVPARDDGAVSQEASAMVDAVIEAFPGATVTDVRAAGGEPGQLTSEEEEAA